jgi:DNA-binding CsgD family transcriptional regulator/PAS domain-containing protein
MPKCEPSIREFSKVVEAIYDCAIDPDRWRATLPMICEFMTSPYGALAIHDYDQDRTARLYDHGYDEEYLRLYAEKYGALNPLPAKMQSLPVGEPATSLMLLDEKKFFASEFYTDFLKPWGLYDSVFCVVLRSDRRTAVLLFNRREKQPRYGEVELQLFHLLEPHVRRAVTISDIMDIKTLEAHTLSATLDNLQTGVIIVAADGRVLHANDAARRMFAAGGPVRSVNGRLSAHESGARGELNRALALSSKNEAGIGASGIGVALSGPQGDPAVAHVLPLARGDLRTRLVPQAMAAVFVSQSSNPLPADMSAIAPAFNLTPAETRLLEHLVHGATLVDTARTLCISQPTAKTHLSHIFSKTGVTRQADLVALVDRLMPPIKHPTVS